MRIGDLYVLHRLVVSTSIATPSLRGLVVQAWLERDVSGRVVCNSQFRNVAAVAAVTCRLLGRSKDRVIPNIGTEEQLLAMGWMFLAQEVEYDWVIENPSEGLIEAKVLLTRFPQSLLQHVNCFWGPEEDIRRLEPIVDSMAQQLSQQRSAS